MFRYLFVGMICPMKFCVSESNAAKSLGFKEEIMSKDIYMYAGKCFQPNGDYYVYYPSNTIREEEFANSVPSETFICGILTFQCSVKLL